MSSGGTSSYNRILGALEGGRKALARARLTAGVFRFLGIALVTVAAVVLWAMVQRWFRFHSVPVAAVASILAAGVVVFAAVRWLVVPLIKVPGRDAFVKLVEKRFPREKNLIVNAYQLGDPEFKARTSGSEELVAALVDRAAGRVGELDIKRWRDPAPDRPYLWAGASAVVVMGLLAVFTPALLGGAVGQVLRPSTAKAPPVTLHVLPGTVEIERGDDVSIAVVVDGTGKPPLLRYRERNGDWRMRHFTAKAPDAVTRDGGAWTAELENVDRMLEYQVQAPRAESDVYAIRVKEPPRIAGYRAHLTYPAYSGLPAETVESGSGDLAGLRGTEVDLRVLTNREMAAGRLEWRVDGAETPERVDLERVDASTWRAPLRLVESAGYSVVFSDEDGRELIRSPRYRVQPAEDRPPHLTLHLPQEDHDLYDDMMEKIVADAADDYGFSSVRLHYRIDDGAEKATAFEPYTAGQNEFRLDTLWDMNGLDLMPGSVVTFFLEVRDNDTVSGPKAARSEVRRIRFPTLAEIYAEVAEDHEREIGTLGDMEREQQELRERMEELTDDMKAGKDVNWETRQELESAMERQRRLEDQVTQAVERLQETVSKASDRAQMNQQLVQKMSELNELLQNVANDDVKRAFQRLSDALEGMNRNQIRDALEDLQASQEQMLQGLDRTIELLKQIRKEEQVEDVVRRTSEIAQLQDEVTKALEEMGVETPEPAPESAEARKAEEQAAEQADAERSGERSESEPEEQEEAGTGESADGERTEDSETAEPQDGERAESGENAENAENRDGERSQEGENQAQSGEEQDTAQENAPLTPEMQEALEEVGRLQEQIAEERKEYMERSNQKNALTPEQQQELAERLAELNERLRQKQEELAQNRQQQQDQKQGQEQQGQEQQSQQQQGQQQQSQQQQGQQQQGQEQSTPEDKERLDQLAEREKQIQDLVEDLRRQLEMLKKLNEDDQQLAGELEDMESGDTMQDMQESMQQAGQSMQGGSKQESAKYAFKARDEANRLAQMAQEMQSGMQARQQEDTIERMQAIIMGLIDVSGVSQEVFESPETDERTLAARQFSLVEKAGDISDSLVALSRQTFALSGQQQGKLRQAIKRMERATRFYELGNLRNARHEGRESTSDLNETIVELMQSHQQMCSRGGGGSSMQQMLERMQGLSEGQQQVNEQTGRLSQGQNGERRLSMTDRERMEWLAAQQEMIRRGLEDVHQEFEESNELLGDLEGLTEDMEEVEGMLREQNLDRELFERQQQILSRLLDAQRSIRQQEMSPERESRTGTLARRVSPPEIPGDLLRLDRTLEEDVLRGASDRYPVQFRRLVEDYFRALARENRTP